MEQLISAAIDFVRFKVQDNIIVMPTAVNGEENHTFTLPLSSPLTYTFFRRYLIMQGLEAVAALLEDTIQYRRITNQNSRVCFYCY